MGYIGRSPYGYAPRYYTPSISAPRYYTPPSYATRQRNAVDAYYNVPRYARGLLMSSRRALLAKEPKGGDKKCQTMLALIESRDDLSMLREILNEAPAIKATLDGQDMFIQLYHMLG